MVTVRLSFQLYLLIYASMRGLQTGMHQAIGGFGE
jgi:hypothetical protein